MDEHVWNAAPFRSGLTVSLLNLLAPSPDEESLRQALATSATAAEAACRDRSCDCGPGCPHCCVLNVAALLPEVLVIARWLEKQLAAPDLAQLRDRLVHHCCRARWMDDGERILKKVVCPFLDDRGCCAIHPVRPLVCRAAHSLDRDACRQLFDPLFTETRPPVPVDLLRHAAYDEAFKALAGTLRSCGLDDRSIELGTGVLTFLEGPEFREIFLAGKKLPGGLWTD